MICDFVIVWRKKKTGGTRRLEVERGWRLLDLNFMV